MTEYEGNHRSCDIEVIPIKVSVNYLRFGGQEYYCAFARYP